MTTLRNTLGRYKIISAAVSVNGIIGADGKALASFANYGRYLTYLHLMTYDIGGPWSEITSPVGPLRTCRSDSSIEEAVDLWTSRGFPASKILVYGGGSTFSNSRY